MKLIFLHGMPGVGKLTVARELAKLTGFRLFHNHLTVDLVRSVFDFGSQPFIELRELIWLEVFRRAAESQVTGLIFTFAFEPSVQSSFIENVQKSVEEHGGEVLFVKLQCSHEELERRVTNPSRQGFGKLTSLDQFRELNEGGAFADPGITPDRMVLDTTSVSPPEAAQTIVSELKLTPA
jgi:hypothetical protein